jgi:MFS superfamily sulfate permease-like transporter
VVHALGGVRAQLHGLSGEKCAMPTTTIFLLLVGAGVAGVAVRDRRNLHNRAHGLQLLTVAFLLAGILQGAACVGVRKSGSWVMISLLRIAQIAYAVLALVLVVRKPSPKGG